MARRRDASTPKDGILTGVEYEAAQTKIAQLKLAAVNMALEGHTMPYDRLRRAMFDPEVLATVDRAEQFSNAYAVTTTYPTDIPGVSVILPPKIGKSSLRPQMFKPQPDFAGFHAALEAAAVQYDRFELVNHVLKRINTKATPGAARYYWPCIKTLCEAKSVPMTVGTFRDSIDIQMILQDIRATSETLAAAALMPDMPPLTSHGDGVTITIQRKHEVYGQGTLRRYIL